MASMLRSLAHRNFRLFFIGQGLSLIGTWMQTTAMAWLVNRLTAAAGKRRGRSLLADHGRLRQPDPRPAARAGLRRRRRPLPPPAHPLPHPDADDAPGVRPRLAGLCGRHSDLAFPGPGGVSRRRQHVRRDGPAGVPDADGRRQGRPGQRHRPELVAVQRRPPGGAGPGGAAALGRRRPKRGPVLSAQRPELFRRAGRAVDDAAARGASRPSSRAAGPRWWKAPATRSAPGPSAPSCCWWRSSASSARPIPRCCRSSPSATCKAGRGCSAF